MKNAKISLVTAICMVLICTIVIGCAAALTTDGAQLQQGTEPEPQPTTPPGTSGDLSTEPKQTEPAPTAPVASANLTVTVEKMCKTYGSYDAIMTLAYNEKGDLVELRKDSRSMQYTYDDQRNLICQKTYFPEGELIAQTSYTYDAFGRLTQTEGFGYNEVYTEYLTQYTYDENGNLIHQKNYTDGELLSEFLYDAKGNLVEANSYYGGEYDLRTVYTYRADGKLQRSETERGGALYSGWEYFYDENGRPIRQERFIMSDGVRKELTNTYTYDENGRCIRYDMGGFQGEHMHETYTYDAMGNMLSSVYTGYDGSTVGYRWCYDGDGRMLSWTSETRMGTTTYTWDYDAQGNVIALTQDAAGTQMKYTFQYTWPEAELPQEVWEQITEQIAVFTGVSLYTPEIYSRLYGN